MNVGLFLNRDVYCCYALNRLASVLDEHRVAIFFSDGVGRAPALEALDTLKLVEHDIPFDYVFRCVDAPGELLTPARIRERFGVSMATMRSPNDPKSLARIRELDLDVIVSIRYGRIFNSDFLQVPRCGVLNLHSGILPDYRGVMASFHALAEGATEIGCTLHYIDDATIDTGPVVSEWRRPVDPSQSYLGHVLSLYEPGTKLVRDALARIANGGSLPARPQLAGDGRYFSFPRAEDVDRFERRGYRWFHASEVRHLLGRFHAG